MLAGLHWSLQLTATCRLDCSHWSLQLPETCRLDCSHWSLQLTETCRLDCSQPTVILKGLFVVDQTLVAVGLLAALQESVLHLASQDLVCAHAFVASAAVIFSALALALCR